MTFLFRIFRWVLLVVALVLLPGAMTAAHAQNLVQNGNFDLGGANWTFGGASGSGPMTGSGANGGSGGYGYINATLLTSGTMTQSINIPTAGNYTLQFYAAPALSLSGILSFRVNIGGTSNTFTYLAPVGIGGYNLYSIVLALPAGVTNLVFTDLSGLLASPLRVDDVSLTPVPIPGPTPGVGMMSYLMVGLLGLLLGWKQIRGRFLRLVGTPSSRN